MDLGLTLGNFAVASAVPAILTLVICIIAISLLSKLMERILSHSKKLDGTLQGFIRSAVKTVLWIITAIIVADSLGIPTTSLVALVSVAGLALSLSLQNIMANLFSGVTLLFTKPFAAGDFVDIAGKAGTVKSISLFYTVINTVDNVVVSIPNGDVTAASIKNYSREKLRRVDMTFSAAYESAAEDVRAAILDAVARDERILTDPAPAVLIGAYKDSTVEYLTRVWCKGADYWDVYFNLNTNVRECFAAHHVEMSYAHMNVHIVEK